MFLFGRLLAEDPSLGSVVKTYGPDWTPTPYLYYLAALDVFETGDLLPTRTSAFGTPIADDWRMSIAWGRTLVQLASEVMALTREAQSNSTRRSESPAVPLLIEQPKWPVNSPFSAIMSRRPPVTRRIQLQTASPQDLMVFAKDHLSRAMFYIPRQKYDTLSSFSVPKVTTFESPSGPSTTSELPFCRANELYMIGYEVTCIAEQFEVASERRSWASWADSIFGQLKEEADTDKGRSPIMRARGRCWLIIGNAHAVDLRSAMNNGQTYILHSKEAGEVRQALTRGIARILVAI